MADCVTSLGGVELDVGAWGIDYAYSCTQKCLAGAARHVAGRSLGCRDGAVRARTTPVPFCLTALLERYWIERPTVYHHTAPILHIYALHEALRLALAEGLERRWARHAEAGAHIRRRLEERGLELLADPANRLAPLTAVRVPEGMNDRGVQTRMLREHAIEVGGGLGPSAPAMWRSADGWQRKRRDRRSGVRRVGRRSVGGTGAAYSS